MIYVSMNTIMSLAFALPAAYAFSRYKFLGDGQMFFWLLTNRMAPPAVFLLPYFQLYSTVNLIDTHIAVALAHCLFNVPLAVWILEGFMSGIPKEIDETAFIDGYSFPRFFFTLFIPLIRAGVGVTAFFLLHVQLGRAAVCPDADGHRGQTDCRHHDPHHQCYRSGLGPSGRQRHPHHRSGRPGHLVRAQPPGQGIRVGPRLKGNQHDFRMDVLDRSDGHILYHHFPDDRGMLVWELVSPTIERRGFLKIPTTRGTRFFVGLLGTAYIHLAWLGLTDLNLWFAMPISAVWIFIVMRWG
jgi:predicted small integral membrane protein